MKKYLLLLIFSIFVISCSKKEMIISGKINNASPLSRVEIIDPTSVATLPIANFGVDEKGNFSDTLQIEKDGVYAMIYQGRVNFLYLKKGQNINITGNGSTFPEDIKIIGDGQGNNEFLFDTQKFTHEYLSKIDVNVLAKNEDDFIKEMTRYTTDISKKIDEIAKAKKADNDVVTWKKDDLLVNILMISSQYELMHGNLTQKQDFKVSDKFKKERAKLEKESFVKDFPTYRQYLLTKLQDSFREFAKPYLEDTQITQTEVFIKFLETQKELSQETKDYLISFVATQFDLHPQNSKIEQAYKAVTETVKTEKIKKEMEHLYHTISGVKVGTIAPEGSLTGQDGKAAKIADLKGKPTLLVFYSSFANGMVEAVAPTLKEMENFYKDKMTFVYINLDDNNKQSQNTANALLKEHSGTKLYAKGGLKSEIAKQYYIYGFKMPSFVVLDKEGKIASKAFLSLVEPEFVEILNKQTGLIAPVEELPEMDEEHTGHNH